MGLGRLLFVAANNLAAVVVVAGHMLVVLIHPALCARSETTTGSPAPTVALGSSSPVQSSRIRPALRALYYRRAHGSQRTPSFDRRKS
jgi:hypothetical protein